MAIIKNARRHNMPFDAVYVMLLMITLLSPRKSYGLVIPMNSCCSLSSSPDLSSPLQCQQHLYATTGKPTALARRTRQRQRRRVTMARNPLLFSSIDNDGGIDVISSPETPLSAEMKDGFGVSQKTIEMKGLLTASSSEEEGQVLSSDTTATSAAEIKEEGIDEVTPVVELRPAAILRFLAPTLALWIAPPIMSLIDTSVVGRYCGATDLAALGPACTLIDSSAYLFMFIATAATNMVATAMADSGKTNDSSASSADGAFGNSITGQKVQRVVSEALFLALCGGVLLASTVFLAGRPLLAGIAGKESLDVVPSALRYSIVRAFGQPAVVMASVARAAALARKDTTGPLTSVAIAFILNAVGTLTLVRVAKLGIVGAAIGTLVADCAAAAFLLIRMKKQSSEKNTNKSKNEIGNINKGIEKFSENKSNQETAVNENDSASLSVKSALISIPTISSFRKFLKFAAPIFFTILGKSIVYNGVGLCVGRFGPIALAAHQVLLRSFFFWTPVGDSVGMTSQVFLPGILAEERKTGKAKKGAKRLLYIVGVITGLCAAIPAWLLPSKGAGLFTTDSSVASALAKTSPILGLSIIMHAIALTCEGMLLAQTDLRFLSNSYILTMIATALYLFSPYRPSTLAGAWWTLALFQGGRALQFSLRNLWLSKSSRSLRQKAH